MSVHVMSWVLRHSDAHLADRLVLLVLADKADADGTNAWPSVATIASEARLTERQVQRSLKSLRESGAIIQTGRHRGANQNHGTYIYAVVMKDDNMSPLENGKGDIHDIPRVAQMSPEPSLEPPKEQTLAAAPRKRNETWDALTALFGEATTRTSQTLRGKICRSLNEAGATPDEILARAKRWRHVFPNAQLTEAALDKHWPLLQPPKPRPERARAPEPPAPSPEERATIAAAAREDMRQRRRSR